MVQSVPLYRHLLLVQNFQAVRWAQVDPQTLLVQLVHLVLGNQMVLKILYLPLVPCFPIFHLARLGQGLHLVQMVH